MLRRNKNRPPCAICMPIRRPEVGSKKFKFFNFLSAIYLFSAEGDPMAKGKFPPMPLD